MNHKIFPIVSIILSAAIYVFFISPLMAEVDKKEQKLESLESVVEQIKTFSDTRDTLLQKYNGISKDDLKKLDVIFPKDTDPVSVALEIKELAEASGLSISGNVSVSDRNVSQARNPAGTSVNDNKDSIRVADLSIHAEGRYQTLILFLTNLSENLRLIDVSSLSFDAPSENETGPSDIYNFNMTLNLFFQNG